VAITGPKKTLRGEKISSSGAEGCFVWGVGGVGGGKSACDGAIQSMRILTGPEKLLPKKNSLGES